MSDAAKTIDQLEATIGALIVQHNVNASTTGDITTLFKTLRSQLDINSGLPTDSPLRSGDEPETRAQAETAKVKATAKK